MTDESSQNKIENLNRLRAIRIKISEKRDSTYKQIVRESVKPWPKDWVTDLDEGRPSPDKKTDDEAA